jgi:O-acetyl-ADP-ribose deacetylase (regulator of RNase III)
MIEFATGNLLDADVEALVNTVNTEGVMGKGVALQFRRAYPANYEAYRAACARGDVVIGRMFVHDTGRLDRPRWIINFPTKRHWRAKSRIADIDAGLADLRDVLARLEIKSVALPALGSGLGGLHWDDVRPRIEGALHDLPVRALVYPPQAPPAPADMPDERQPPYLTAVRAALLGLLARFATPEEGATPLAVQKLLYFLQAAGEPLQLEFARGKYGPYADATRHVVQALEGHYLIGYGDGTGDRAIRLLPQAAAQAEAQLHDHPDTLERFERVAELIDGFESPYGLELLATTHWAANQDGARNADEAIDTVRRWSARKERLFTPDHIRVAWDRLDATGWLSAKRVPTPA